MIFVFGTKQYGKVDHVPGLFYVATSFFHLQFLPLIPVGSYLMLDHPGGQGKSGVRIGLSGKSILFAWLRLVFVLAGAILAFLGVMCLLDRGFGGGVRLDTCIILVGASAACFSLLWASYRLSRAKPVRALRLAGRAGISPEVVAQFFASSLSEAELEQLAQTAQVADAASSDGTPSAES